MITSLRRLSSFVGLSLKTGLTIASCAFLLSCKKDQTGISDEQHFYLNNSGDDAADGSLDHPWQTLSKINSISFRAGDSVFLEGGQTFKGTLQFDNGDTGLVNYPIAITSKGKTVAIIDAGNAAAIVANGSSYLSISRLHLIGAGRKTGNTRTGADISGGTGFTLDSIEAEGFQKCGVSISNSSHSALENIYAHDNGAAGILITGTNSKFDCHHISLRNSKAENNPGDPTNFTNHSGNGILAGYCSNVLIEYCTATNNGWDMPRIGNGPVGIWTYESDSVIIQHCISYKNKTSNGGEDGGGFDLDGGVTNAVLQYCLSYGNQGSGFGIFQYSGASQWNNNIVRFCISENDGTVSAAKAGLYIWNGSQVEADFTHFYFYNNVVYNTTQAAVSYSPINARDKFFFFNNILVGYDALIRGTRGNDTFIGNDWRNLTSGFSIEGETNFNNWTATSGEEKYDGKIVGYSTEPQFKAPGIASITDPYQLTAWDNYSLSNESPLKTGGLDLKKLFGIEIGGLNFSGKPASALTIGVE